MAKLPRMAAMAVELLQHKAQDIGTLFRAHAALAKLGKDRYMASGVIVSVTNLSGKPLVEPVLIADGLSRDTIDALRRDVKASYDYRLTMNKIKDTNDV